MSILLCPNRPSCDLASVDWASVDWSSIDWTRLWATDPTTAGAPFRRDLTVYGINEPTPGPRWKALFDATWPGYRQWYLSEGLGARPELAEGVAMLSRHMPELVPAYEALVALADDDVAARMLTMWNLPAFAPACSQAVVTEPAPALCRNYDYGPDLWERVVYSSAFTGRRVIGTSDCLWGLLDGMNDAGLVVSLTYGGAPGSGRGFAIPLVIRYVLEVATTVAEARNVLCRLPVSMSYNLTMLDASGEVCTAYLDPGMPARFTPLPATTNHRGEVPEHPERAATLGSVERLASLRVLLADRPTPDRLAANFLERPLFNDEYSRSFGTLYTALYRPAAGVVEYIWHGKRWSRTFDDPDDTVEVTLEGR